MRQSIRRMPELPDVVLYIEALEPRLRGARLERVRLLSPFVLRSVDPPLAAAAGRAVSGLRRLGKRIVIGLDGDLFLLLHLMIAGRLHWRPAGARPPGKIGLAALDFSTGTLVLTEAGTKRRAAIHLGRREIPRGGHGVPRRDGRPRALRQAVPGVRRSGAAHRPRRERDELLRAVPDGRPAPRRPRALTTARGGLAADARGTGGAKGYGRRGRTIGWPCGVARAARSHSSFRVRSAAVATSPLSATIFSSAASQSW